MLPLDTSCQAEYADGYIHDETTLNDVSPYGPYYEEVQEFDDNGVSTGNIITQEVKKNIFSDILEKRPEAQHGKLVRFSIFYKDSRYDIDWRGLPENARPIRFRHGFATISQTGEQERGWSGIDFGYQYNDVDGKNHQEVQELR